MGRETVSKVNIITCAVDRGLRTTSHLCSSYRTIRVLHKSLKSFATEHTEKPTQFFIKAFEAIHEGTTRMPKFEHRPQ